MLKQILTLCTFAMLTTAPVFAEEMAAEMAPEMAAPAESSAPVAIGGYVGAVSNYVWRGTQQNSGAASVQGGLDLSFPAVEGLGLGLWVASIGGGDTRNETDYYVSYEGSAGDLGYSTGLTLYSYDFSTFTTITKSGEEVNVAVQKEISLGLSYGDFGFTYYTVLADDSTYGAGDDAESSIGLDWVALSYGTSLIGMDLGVTYETGSYNQQWVNAGNALETTAIATYSLGKSISDSTSVSFNGTKVLTNSDVGDALKNEFWMSMDLSF
ncbi:MAG: hypothetical protein QNL04_03090 [SAR324 cluster bacterium]|nr:hypothetical protein [SAR324 cluster bacterium]